MPKKKIVILGSTSSIGKSLLDIIKKDRQKFQIELLTANTNYEVLINTTKTKGFMSMGIANLKSNVKDAPTYLISSYLCHPSLANDNLSGPILSILLWRRLAQMENLSCNWTLQISPETIGALAWLDQFKETAKSRVFFSVICL